MKFFAAVAVLLVALVALTTPALALAPYTYSCLPASAQVSGGARVVVLIHNPQVSDTADIYVTVRSRGGNDLTSTLGVPSHFILEAGRTTGRPPDRDVSWYQPVFAPPIDSDDNAGNIPMSVTVRSSEPVNVTVQEAGGGWVTVNRPCSLTQPQVP